MHSTPLISEGISTTLSSKDKVALNQFSYRLTATASKDCPMLMTILSREISRTTAGGLSVLIYDFFQEKSQKFISSTETFQYIHPFEAVKMAPCSYLIKTEQLKQKKDERQKALDRYIASLNLGTICDILMRLHTENCFQSWTEAIKKTASETPKRCITYKSLFVIQNNPFMRS